VQVAAEFSLSVVRVGQIAAQQRHLNGDAPRRARPMPPAQPTQGSFKVKTPEASAEGAQQPEPQPEAPTTPRKLAVIPPSMKNPELFAEAKPIKIPDPAKVDVSMFADDYPL
jgi:hypothetical protein